MSDAYVTGLKILARRELSEAQLRFRLTRRKFESDDIDSAVARLRGEGALDDHRAARACARTEAFVKRHGRLRALRKIEALGIAQSVARDAVSEVFADLDEDALIAQAIDRRLGRDAAVNAGPTPEAVRRVHRYLLAQGFEASRVAAAFRRRRVEISPDE